MTGVRLFMFRTTVLVVLPGILAWAFIDRLISGMRFAFRMAWLDARSVWGDAIEAWNDAATMSWDEMKTKVEKSRE